MDAIDKVADAATVFINPGQVLYTAKHHKTSQARKTEVFEQIYIAKLETPRREKRCAGRRLVVG